MRAPRSGPAAFTGFLLIDLVVPLASYYVLRALGASVWTALLAGAALPMLRLSAGLVLRRRVPGASLFALGLITVGTADVADLAPEQLRQHVVLVTQEHHVFAYPLRDNLTIAAPHATDDELLEALDVLGADWFDDLPEGLDTDLGTHRIGGARAQHVALARVLLANPHTLVLDEATALLDPTTARRTEQALAATIQGRTIIAVAHRLQTARDTDRIAIMEGGRITELGHHDHLVTTATSYAALWETWSADTSHDRTDNHE